MGEKAILYKLYTSSTRNTFLLCLLNRTSPRRTAEDLSEFLHSIEFSAIWKNLPVHLGLVRPFKDIVYRHVKIIRQRDQRLVIRLPRAGFVPTYAVLIQPQIHCKLQLGYPPVFLSAPLISYAHPLAQAYQTGILIISRFGISHKRRWTLCTKSRADFCWKCYSCFFRPNTATIPQLFRIYKYTRPSTCALRQNCISNLKIA